MVTPEHHGALVDRLVQETTPIRPLWSVRTRLAVFAALAAVAVIAVAGLAPRPDLGARLHDPSFLLELTALALATVFVALLALRNAVPGRSPSRLESLVALGLVIAAAFASLTQPDGPPLSFAAWVTVGWMCAARTLVVAALPWALLLIAIRRGAPIHVSSAAAYAGGAALLLATMILRTACPLDGASHWLLWHFGTIVLGSGLSAALTATWLATWRHR